MLKVTVQNAAKDLSRLIDLACRGQEVVISCSSKVMVRLEPIRQANGDRKPGRLKGKIKYSPDAFAALTDQEMKKLGFT